MSFVNKIKSQSGISVELILGEDENGKPFHGFILMKASNMDTLRKEVIIKKGQDLSDYGVVLLKGEGHEVPEGVAEEVIATVEEFIE